MGHNTLVFCRSERAAEQPLRSQGFTTERIPHPTATYPQGQCRFEQGKVEAQPDITMPDLAAWLNAQHGMSADPSNLSKLLCRAGFTFKKNADGSGARTRRRQTGV